MREQRRLRLQRPSQTYPMCTGRRQPTRVQMEGEHISVNKERVTSLALTELGLLMEGQDIVTLMSGYTIKQWCLLPRRSRFSPLKRS